MDEYKLQVLVPRAINGDFMAENGLWTTFLDEGDLDYMKAQATILRVFHKSVRIIQERQVVIEETVIDG